MGRCDEWCSAAAISARCTGERPETATGLRPASRLSSSSCTSGSAAIARLSTSIPRPSFPITRERARRDTPGGVHAVPVCYKLTIL